MVPWRYFTFGAGAGAAFAAVFLDKEWSRPIFIYNFMSLWLTQLGIFTVYSIFLYPFFLSPLRHLPQVNGGGWLFGQYSKIVRDGLGRCCREWTTQVDHGGFFRILSAFNREFLVVTSPAALAEILVTKSYDFQKPAFLRDTLGMVIGYGLIVSEGDQHKLQRRNLMPAFSFRHVKDLYPVFWDKARQVAQAMAAQMDKDGVEALEVGEWASRCTLDIIGVAGMGQDFHAIQDGDNELTRTYMSITSPSRRDRVMMAAGGYIGSIVSLKMIAKYIPLPRIREARRAAATIRSVCLDLIRVKRDKLAKKELDDVDILSIALKSSLFSDDELADQLMTFLAAGHETTASALTWAVYALCRHPPAQTRLRDEVREKLPPISADAGITSLDIDRLPYLNAVCNEVLRMYSPVPQTLREPVRDTYIQNQYIPKGTRLCLAPWATNMDPSLWGVDAHEFKPERWLVPDDDNSPEAKKRAANGGASSNYAFLSFLHGPRSCIGASFARAEFACLLAAWVGRFEFELQDSALLDERNMVMEQLVTVKAVNGLHVRLKPVSEF